MKGRLFIFIFLIIIFSSGLVKSQIGTGCFPKANLINQDPYPAVPGEYVKIVFQIDGVDNPSCGGFQFELIEKFPFSLRQEISPTINIQSGIYERNYPNYLLAPYELLVDKTALDGENIITVSYGKVLSISNLSIIKDFNITVENTQTDFEVSVKDYIPDTNIISFEILNIGEIDVEAVTIEILKQDNLNVKGSTRNIIGDLDSNEDTVFSYEATPKEGEIKIRILYTDKIKTRRILEKTVYYDPSYFTERKRDETKISASTYILTFMAVMILVFWLKYHLKKKHLKKIREHSH